MKKIYKFNNLSEDAKKRAVEVVHEQEINKEQDWTVECREITENIKYIINEEVKLDCDDISWEENYGISIDLSSVSMTEEYLKKVLSKEEYSELGDEVAELGGRLATKLSEKVNVHITALVDRLKKIVQDGCDYLGTEEYYHDQLEADCSPVDTYLFSYQGELILIDGEYIDSKFEEIYHNCEMEK
ncbi:hypothetical protein R3O67_34305 [Bacillus cereus]|uniref:hypothetical protein n=1 Tax=Bacillus cereus TaxID=1396 RepID=UPI00307B0D7A